jgi:hypothetical protein
MNPPIRVILRLSTDLFNVQSWTEIQEIDYDDGGIDDLDEDSEKYVNMFDAFKTREEHAGIGGLKIARLIKYGWMNVSL